MKTTTNVLVEGAAVPNVDPSADAEQPSTDVSWVDRCQRQFGDSDRRLRNLADDENCAFYDGV